MERCLEIRNIFMVNDFLSSKKSMVVDVILFAMLVCPEQLIVGWIIWVDVGVRVVTQMLSD